MDLKIRIRPAKPEDAEKLLAIYAPYVEQTAITFEYEVPTVEEFRERIHNTLKKYPYLVAEQGGEPVGYAYVGPFHDRPAYDWAVETSIYVDQNKKRMGIGKKLHEALEEELNLLQHAESIAAALQAAAEAIDGEDADGSAVLLTEAAAEELSPFSDMRAEFAVLGELQALNWQTLLRSAAVCGTAWT